MCNLFIRILDSQLPSTFLRILWRCPTRIHEGIVHEIRDDVEGDKRDVLIYCSSTVGILLLFFLRPIHFETPMIEGIKVIFINQRRVDKSFGVVKDIHQYGSESRKDHCISVKLRRWRSLNGHAREQKPRFYIETTGTVSLTCHSYVINATYIQRARSFSRRYLVIILRVALHLI